MSCPTRAQWRVLAAFRGGPLKRMPPWGPFRTKKSVQRRGWVFWSEVPGYHLTDDGKRALAAGDRRYGESERTYARRPL